MLQNVHLMQSWLPTLVLALEGLGGTVNESFRCFLSAEPPPLPTMQNMPEALLQVFITTTVFSVLGVDFDVAEAEVL